MLEMFLSLLQKLWFIARPFVFLLCLYALFFCIVTFITFCKNKQKFVLVKSTYKKQGLFYKLFMIPYMVGYTIAHSDPNTFKPHGVVMFEGRQGCGKSSAMFKYALDLKEQYPLCKIICNTSFDYSDKRLSSWEDMLTERNGTHGLVCILDETQQWFNSKQSKDFPPECLSYITQLRKERKIVLGTCQQFYMVSKDIRTQVSELRRCRCIFGCFNIVIRTRPVVDSTGEIIKYQYLGFYTFVQTNKLRNCYDTYETVKNLAKSGFQEKTKVIVRDNL